jgi:O-antigen/teichoic acid export membrane protein
VAYNLVSTVDKALTVLLSIAALLIFSGGINAYFAAMALAEAIVTAGLLWWLLSRYEFSLRAVSWNLGRTMLAFGVPLAATEIGYLLLLGADRYLLAAISGAEELAIYSVGYNLPSYVNDAVVFSLSYAITPLYTNMYRQRGAAAVSEFLGRALHYYVAGMLLAVAGYAALDSDLIRWLASDKYARSASFSAVVLFSLMLMGSNYITCAGLYLHKKSRTVLAIMIGCVVINVAANLVLIPAYGAAGAAYATLFACAVSAAVTCIAAYRYMPFRLGIRRVVYYVVAAAVLYLVMSSLNVGSAAINVAVKLAAGAGLVAIAVFLGESELRQEWRRWRSGSAVQG